jgi:hypothetical protein
MVAAIRSRARTADLPVGRVRQRSAYSGRGRASGGRRRVGDVDDADFLPAAAMEA